MEIGFDDLHWGYGEEPTIHPHRHFGDGKAYTVKVEPAPAYAHSAGQVEFLLYECNRLAPVCAPVTVNILHVSDRRGVNGWAQQQWEYSACHTPDDCQCETSTGKTRNWDGVIVLSGRTTEIHPAIARYVVPHEYGHLVEDALGLIRYGHEDTNDPAALLIREWASVRKIPEEVFNLPYGRLTHHLVPTEIFANDFRFAIGFETDWWPHGEVVPPLGKRGTAKAVRWWVDALDQLGACYREVAGS
jgi:hypothetical protein